MRRVRSSPESDRYDGDKLHEDPDMTWTPPPESQFSFAIQQNPKPQGAKPVPAQGYRRNTTLSFGSMVSSLCDGSGDILLKCLSHEGKPGLLDLHLDWDVLKDDNRPQRGLRAGNHLGVQNRNPWSEPVTFLPSPECGSRQKLVLALVK